MAIAVVMDFKGATLDQYDKVMEKMGLAATPRPCPSTACPTSSVRPTTESV